MDKNSKIIPTNQEFAASGIASLCRNSIDLIRYARQIAARQVNLVQLMTFYSLGRWIVEEQQHGERRAKYGQQAIARLSRALTEKYGRGISVDNLENMRKLYLAYKDRISEMLFRKFAVLLCSEKNDNVVALTLPENANIYASKYELYLPDKKLLQEKLKQWIEEETGGEEL